MTPSLVPEPEATEEKTVLRLVRLASWKPVHGRMSLCACLFLFPQWGQKGKPQESLGPLSQAVLWNIPSSWSRFLVPAGYRTWGWGR